MKCADCKFWQAVDYTHGECHRRSPLMDRWPYTIGTDWCGEFEISPSRVPCAVCSKPVGLEAQVDPRQEGKLLQVFETRMVCNNCYDKLKK
jgi:hypothetical protein